MLTTYSLAAIFLLASSPPASAQITYPKCDSSWSWSYNTLGQSPCAVGAYLQGACNHGVFTLPDLVSDDYSYVGPTVPSDFSNLCKCNTVVYSLMSACDTCQGANWFSWETWAQNCTAVDPPQTFSHTIPNGTRAPGWAFIDVNKEGTWDPVLAYQYGNQVEIGPGEPATMTSLPAPTTSQTAVPGLSSSQAQFLSEVKKHHSTKARKIATIVGGVIGGIVLVAALVALLLWRARIRRRRTTRAASAIIFSDRRDRSMKMKENVSKPIKNIPLDIPSETI